MGTLVINYADSNLPTFITRVVEVKEPILFEEMDQEEKQLWIEEQIESNTQKGANGAQQVLVFHTRKEV